MISAGLPLAISRRGKVAETVHLVAFAAAESGRIVADSGDLDLITYYRSTAKPMQALAVVSSGAADRFGFDDRCLALTCASHDGTPAHSALAHEMLARAETDPALLRCPGHLSLNPSVRREQLAKSVVPGPLEDNCSGKHAGMLAAAKALSLPQHNYFEQDHPLQRLIKDRVAELAQLDVKQVSLGGDGCGAPNYAVPLGNLALSWARFMTPDGLPRELRDACARLTAAMRAHPELVAGDGRFDTRLMQATDAEIVSKVGADGLQLCAAPGRGRALAVKALDGRRDVAERVTVALLLKLGWLAAEPWPNCCNNVLKNRLGEPVGEVLVDLSTL